MVSGTDQDLQDVFFTNSGIGYAVGKNATILKYDNLTALSETERLSANTEVYPNPTSGFVTTTAPAEVTTYRVTDAVGKVITEAPLTGQSAQANRRSILCRQ